MSSKNSNPAPRSKAKTVTKIAIFLGLGLGFSGELAGSAWLGWWIGNWWKSTGGPDSAPELTAVGFILLALVHVTWLLYRISAAQERGERIGEDA